MFRQETTKTNQKTQTVDDLSPQNFQSSLFELTKKEISYPEYKKQKKFFDSVISNACKYAISNPKDCPIILHSLSKIAVPINNPAIIIMRDNNDPTTNYYEMITKIALIIEKEILTKTLPNDKLTLVLHAFTKFDLNHNETPFNTLIPSLFKIAVKSYEENM